MDRRAALITLAALGGVAGSLGSELGCERRRPALRLGTNLWPGYEPLYLARDQGLLDRHRVNLREFTSASEVLRGLRNGMLEAGCLTLDEVMVLVAEGFPMAVMLVLDASHGADALVVQPGLRNLRGCTLGVEPNALGAYMLLRTLEHLKLKATEVRVVELAIDDQEARFRAGKVDGVITFEPVRTQLILAGGQVAFDSTQLPGEIVDVLAVRRSALVPHRETLAHLRSAWHQGLDLLGREPDRAHALMGRRLGLTPPQVQQALKGLRFFSEAEELEARRRGLHPTVARLSEVMLQAMLLPRGVTPEEVLGGGP